MRTVRKRKEKEKKKAEIPAMSSPVPLAEITKSSACLKREAEDCIDISQDVARYTTLVNMMGPNLGLADLLHIAHETALNAPPGEKRDKAREILEATVARYEKIRHRIPARKAGQFVLARLKYFMRLGDAEECRRLVLEGDECEFSWFDMRRAVRLAREDGHDEAVGIVERAVASWK